MHFFLEWYFALFFSVGLHVDTLISHSLPLFAYFRVYPNPMDFIIVLLIVAAFHSAKCSVQVFVGADVRRAFDM